MRRRRYLTALGSTIGVAVGGCTQERSPAASTVLSLSSSAVAAGASIPVAFTCDGADVSPPLSFGDVPGSTESLAVMVDDPDAGSEPFTHWLLWDLSPDVGHIPRNVPDTETVPSLGDARQGTNGFDTVGYRGPCPPPADDAHTYRFRAYAFKERLGLEAGATASAFNDAIDGRLVGTGGFLADYDR